jgi:hypothetical protein
MALNPPPPVPIAVLSLCGRDRAAMGPLITGTDLAGAAAMLITQEI